MKRTFNEDYKCGLTNEKKVINYLNDNGHNYKQYKNKCELFDFTDGRNICELKSRNNDYDKYPTTIFGQNKIENLQDDKIYWFYFLFKDGLYRWKFNKDEYTIKTNGRSDRGRNEYKPHCNVNIKYLSLVTKDITS